MMYVFSILEFLASFVEHIAALVLGARISNENKIKWKQSIIASLIIAFITWCINQYKLFSVYTTFIVIIELIICVKIIYKAKISDAMILNIGYYVVLYISDFLTITVLGVIVGKNEIFNMIAEEFSPMRALAIVISKTLLIVVCYFFAIMIPRKIEICAWKAGCGLLVGCSVMYYLISSSFKQAQMSILVLWSLLFVLVLVAIYTINQYLDYLKQKNQIILVSEKNRLIVEYYKTVIESYSKNRIFYHDLKNQYLIIKKYLESKEYEKAEMYMKEMSDLEYVGKEYVFTGKEEIDILLVNKKSCAEELGIEVEIFAEKLEICVGSHDLIVLLGNAIDNAIEACRNMNQESHKYIKIVIRKIKEITYIEIKNSYGKEPCIVNGKLISGKKDELCHGLGMESMRNIVDKYKGVMAVEYKSGEFIFACSFFE